MERHLFTRVPPGAAGCQAAPTDAVSSLDTASIDESVKDDDCIHFLQWALPRLGLRWAGFRRVRGQVCKRLRRRLAALGLKDLSDYRVLLETDAAQWRQLDDLCRVSVSRFYRDQGVWRCLERELLPQLAAQASVRGETRLRIWSAGCASGEEPYTLALMFALGDTPMNCTPEILATDTDPQLLARARRACYPGSSLRELAAQWRTAFERSGEEFCLRPAYRSPVRFLAQDIRRDLPDGRFDLVLCRNLVFTYFEVPLQAAIAGRLTEVLVPGGLLLLGSHESLPEAARSAAVTHDHPEGIKGAQATALAVFLARVGTSKAMIKAEIQDRVGYDLTRPLDAIRPGYRFDVSCQGSVPESLIAFLESADYEGAVRNAISLSGDTDTMACIAGGIAQAFYGSVPAPIAGEMRSRLPDGFLDVLNRFERRYELATSARG